MDFLEHERLSYDYQTTARRLSGDDLERAFRKMAATYAFYFRRELSGLRGPAFDMPCGYGNFLYFLRRQGIECDGMDLDPRQVGLARSLDLPAEVGDGLGELARRRDLGLVSSLDFLEHIDKDEAVVMLRNAYAALRPGGLLILRMPSADGPFGAHDFANDLTHRWLATASVMENLLAALGFVEIRVQGDYPAPVHARGWARFIAHHLTRRILSLLVIGLGMTPPRIWSRSMWVIGRRPA